MHNVYHEASVEYWHQWVVEAEWWLISRVWVMFFEVYECLDQLSEQQIH